MRSLSYLLLLLALVACASERTKIYEPTIIYGTSKVDCIVTDFKLNEGIKVAKDKVSLRNFSEHTSVSYSHSRDYGSECGFWFDTTSKQYSIDDTEVILKKDRWKFKLINYYSDYVDIHASGIH